MTVFAIVNGFFYPLYSSIIFAWWITCRFIYGIGYMKNGPEGRILGRNLEFISHLLFVLLTIYNGY
jgi:hypothetical protein